MYGEPTDSQLLINGLEDIRDLDARTLIFASLRTENFLVCW